MIILPKRIGNLPCGKIFFQPFLGWFHACRSLLPIGGAHFAIIFEIDQSVKDAQRFVNRTAHRKVVDDLMPDNPVPVDQEKASEGDALVFD